MKTIGFIAALLALAAPAVRAASDGTSHSPDIFVLVGAQRGDNQIAITYPTPTPHPQVQRDLAALQSQTGWTIRKPEITDDPAPIRGSKDVMTSLCFSANNAVAPGAHAFPIEPIVTALRGYNHILITYLLNAQIDYTGLRDYQDKNVTVSFKNNGPAYTYDVKLLNPRFQKLNLPLYQPPASTVRAASSGTGGHHAVKPWQVALVAVLAAAAGGAVYMAMAKHS